MASLICRSRSRKPLIICEACLGNLFALRNIGTNSPRYISSAARSATRARRTPNVRDGALHQYTRTSTNVKSIETKLRRYSSTPPPYHEPHPPKPGYAQLSHRRLVALSGPDAAKFLQGLVTNNVDPDSQTPFYSAFLDARGRVLWDVFIWTYPALTARNGSWACYIEVDAGEIEALVKHLRRHKLRSKINISMVEEEMSVWAVWGEREKLGDLAEGGASLADPRLLSSSMTLQRFLLSSAQSPKDSEFLKGQAKPLEESLSEYHLFRYLYGIPEGPTEIPRESALPMEYNIDLSQGIDFKKGCYVGQELTIRTKHTGVVRKRILPVELHRSDSSQDTASQIPTFNPRILSWDVTEGGADIKQLDEEGSVKKGRAAGKLITTLGNVGLALCRLEMMTSMKVSAEGGTWKPGMQFGVQNEKSGEVVKVRPFVRDAFQTRSPNRSSLSKLIYKLRTKRDSKSKDQLSIPQDLRSPLAPSPLPLVLPEHQHALSRLGWTTITLPEPKQDSTSPDLNSSSPGPHPLQSAYEDLFRAAQAFFDSPDDDKIRWKHRLGSEEGWSKIPGEKEFITLRTLSYTPDVLKAPAKRYWDLMGAHLSSTLGRISTTLGLPDGEDEGLRRFVGTCGRMGQEESDKTASMLRIFRYEGWDAKVVAEAHADLGLLSAVVGDVAGLEVWDGRGWFDVERRYEGRQASVLVGRQLEKFSNGRYPAGGHRVVSYGKPQREAQKNTEEAEEEKRYRHSIVFVLRAHEPVVVDSDALETGITGKWAESVKGVTAGKLYEEIRSKHFNINIGIEEREKQRRNVRETKTGSGGKIESKSQATG
ncbi:hypothetical protein N0V90_004994 [Kalmusia sp. IMI 367209]|nr:hypothetical protein N0V90_004994 [Kalmusia sp. IMI 367209]